MLRRRVLCRRTALVRELLKNIKHENSRILGHIMRDANSYHPLQLVIMTNTEGRRGDGRGRTSWLETRSAEQYLRMSEEPDLAI